MREAPGQQVPHHFTELVFGAAGRTFSRQVEGIFIGRPCAGDLEALYPMGTHDEIEQESGVEEVLARVLAPVALTNRSNSAPGPPPTGRLAYLITMISFSLPLAA